MTSDFDDTREFKITTKEVWRDMQEFRKETKQDMQEFRNETRLENSELRTLLSKIDTKLDVALVSVENSSQAVADHETRIRVMEKAIWRAGGAAAIIGASLGYIATQLTK